MLSEQADNDRAVATAVAKSITSTLIDLMTYFVVYRSPKIPTLDRTHLRSFRNEF
jgi:hypothetical protein